MKFDLLETLLPLIVALVFLGLGWFSTRNTFGGRELPSHMNKSIIYAFFFVLGIIYAFFFVLGNGYLMLFAAQLNWSKPSLFTAIGGWGALLCLIAWWRYRRSRSANLRTPAP